MVLELSSEAKPHSFPHRKTNAMERYSMLSLLSTPRQLGSFSKGATNDLYDCSLLASCSGFWTGKRACQPGDKKKIHEGAHDVHNWTRSAPLKIACSIRGKAPAWKGCEQLLSQICVAGQSKGYPLHARSSEGMTTNAILGPLDRRPSMRVTMHIQSRPPSTPL